MPRHAPTSTCMVLVLVLVLVLGAPALAASGAGAGAGGIGNGGDSQEPTGARGYEAVAWTTYERGLHNIERALEIERRAHATADPARRDELLRRARDEYGRALRQLDSALARQSNLYQALSDKGFVLRHLGDYEKALGAYGAALAIEPGYARAIEYRGEAYLELGRLDDAKGAYRTLLGAEAALAARLLGGMQAWLERQREAPGALDPAALDAFAGWVAERARLADALPAAERPAEAASHWPW